MMKRRSAKQFPRWLLVAVVLLAGLLPAGAQTNRINFNGQNLFLSGANFAWRNFAADIGPGTTDFAHFSSVFGQVRASGGNTMRLWLHTHGGNTPAWTGTGPSATVTGPGTGTISDLTAILDSAWSNRVSVVLCLWSFDMLRTSFGASITDRARNILTNDAARGTYVTNALIPMVQALKDHPAILAWEIFNEPEGMSLEHGWPDIVTTGRVPMASIQKFVNHCAAAIHSTDPDAKVSNGSWSFISQSDVGAGNFNYYRDDRLIAAGGYTNGILDFYMVHYYDWAGTALSPFHNNASYWGLNKPLVVAEFYPNVAEGCVNCGNDGYENLYQRGYAGALAWSWTDSTPAVMLALMAGMSNAHPADVLITTNSYPVVTLTAPTNGQSFALGATVALAATATDANGSITKVEFFQGTNKLGEDFTAPYQFNWTNPPAGNYALMARATDNSSLVSTSGVVNITVGSSPGPTRLEAEAATRTGGITVGSAAGASGGQYLYMQADGTITWTVTNCPATGTYNLTIGYFIPSGFGEKTQNLRINGGTGTPVVFTLPENIWQTKVVSVSLNAGSNTIALEKNWGYMYFDYIELPFGTLAATNTPPVFSTPPTNRAVPELSPLTVTNAATDSDLPAQTLTYQLLNPPGGAGINPQGVITWTPTEAQGPSTNAIVTVVSDGVASITNSFQVIVTEVNQPPTFSGNPGNRSIPELTTLTVTNNASDSDLPAQTLTYQLLNPPGGAGINAQGVITWTPTEAQGPSTNGIVTVVSDGVASITNSFQVNVTEVNQSPTFLATPGNRSIPELTTLTVTNAATDNDLPAQTLTYQLLNPPGGAAINSQGVITWTPTEAQGPSTNAIVTVVSDGVASVTNSFQVTVTEVNQPPTFLATPGDVSLPEFTLLTVTNVATDADWPAQTITYQLISPPGGASIDAGGIITWNVGAQPGGSTNVISTVATDSVTAVTNFFTVVVTPVARPPLQLGGSEWQAGAGFSFSFDVPAGMPFVIEASDPLGAWSTLTNGVGQAGSELFTDTTTSGHPQRYYRLRY